MRKSRKVLHKKYALIGYNEEQVKNELDQIRSQLLAVQAVREQEAEAFWELNQQKMRFQSQLIAQLNECVEEERLLSGRGETHESN